MLSPEMKTVLSNWLIGRVGNSHCDPLGVFVTESGELALMGCTNCAEETIAARKGGLVTHCTHPAKEDGCDRTITVKQNILSDAAVACISEAIEEAWTHHPSLEKQRMPRVNIRSGAIRESCETGGGVGEKRVGATFRPFVEWRKGD